MSNTAEKIDVEALMRQIREDVKATLAKSGNEIAPFHPGAVSDARALSPVILSEELHYLNSHWSDCYSPQHVESHRKVLGKAIVFLKRRMMSLIWTTIMRDYVDRERKFFMNLVRFLNSTARYIDARDNEVTLQMAKKIDHDISETHQRFDRMIGEVDGTLRAVELELSRRIAQVESLRAGDQGAVRQLTSDMKHLDEMCHGLERMLSLLAKPAEAASISNASVENTTPRTFESGLDYLLLENRFRGSEALIRERMRDYVEIFRGATKPVVDVGCGRGEFLELLRENNIPCLGIDLDDSMVAWSKAKGFEVWHGDALKLLEGLPDASLGGLIASQVVEHLTKEQLERFIELSRAKVVPGGAIVYETINPNSVLALSRNFFRDPTHVWPVHPETLQFVMEMKGVAKTEIRYRSAYPEEVQLKGLVIDGTLPARWNSVIERINEAFGKLNSLLFGHQDYCIIGRTETPRSTSASSHISKP